jgi:hypothetical protein
MVEGDTLTSGPRHVIDISPIDSSSSGKSTTCDCDDFIGGTEGDVTHGLKITSVQKLNTSSSETSQVFLSTKSMTRPSLVKSVTASHGRYSPQSQATNYEGHNNSNDNFNQSREI